MTKVFKKGKNLVWLVENVGIVKLEEVNQLTYVRCSPVNFLRWKGKQLSQVFANKAMEDFLNFFFFACQLCIIIIFFQLVALASCHEMGFYNNEWILTAKSE